MCVVRGGDLPILQKELKMADNETTKAFNDMKDIVNKMDPTEVEGFIVLVQGQNAGDEKHFKGLQAVCGNLKTLMNLLSNLRGDILNPFVVGYTTWKLGETDEDSKEN